MDKEKIDENPYIICLRDSLHKKVDALCNTENFKTQHLFDRQEEIRQLTDKVVQSKYGKKDMPLRLEKKLYQTRIAFEKASLKQRVQQDIIDRSTDNF